VSGHYAGESARVREERFSWAIARAEGAAGEHLRCRRMAGLEIVIAAQV
jgi:hypothetical protein